MYKEIIISAIVIILVIVGDVITQNNTKKSVEQFSGNLSSLREEVVKDDVNKEEVYKRMEKTEKEWKESYQLLACYIEHNELEKVQTELKKLRADIDMEEYSMCVENLETCIFVLEHIRDKTALKIINIF